MTNQNLGNLTTIIKTISMMIAGYAIGYFISIGLNLPITQEQLSEIIGTITLFILAYLDAKYPNCFGFLGNNTIIESFETEEDLINDEYEC